MVRARGLKPVEVRGENVLAKQLGLAPGQRSGGESTLTCVQGHLGLPVCWGHDGHPPRQLPSRRYPCTLVCGLALASAHWTAMEQGWGQERQVQVGTSSKSVFPSSFFPMLLDPVYPVSFIDVVN